MNYPSIFPKKLQSQRDTRKDFKKRYNATVLQSYNKLFMIFRFSLVRREEAEVSI